MGSGSECPFLTRRAARTWTIELLKIAPLIIDQQMMTEGRIQVYMASMPEEAYAPNVLFSMLRPEAHVKSFTRAKLAKWSGSGSNIRIVRVHGAGPRRRYTTWSAMYYSWVPCVLSQMSSSLDYLYYNKGSLFPQARSVMLETDRATPSCHV